MVYAVANIWIGIDTWVFWANSITELTNIGKPAPSEWAPVAKTCGQLLNINCALLIVRPPCLGYVSLHAPVPACADRVPTWLLAVAAAHPARAAAEAEHR